MLLLFVNPVFAKSQQVEPSEKLVIIAHMLAFPDFPKAHDILAIAKIESRFNEKARNGISRGVMQVNHGPWDLTLNVQAGVKLLRSYYEQLGSAKAAIVAYNIGIGNYIRGKRNPTYFAKYQGAKNEILRESYSDVSRGSGVYNHSYLPNGRVPGLTGSILFNPVSVTYQDTVCEREDRTGRCLDETSRTLSPSLGEVRKEDP